MRLVDWTDREGRKHKSLVLDTDPDYKAPEGMLQDPPDTRQVDWDAVERELHNALIERGLITWLDVQREQNGITSAVVAVLKNRIVRLYREAANTQSEGGLND